jgi:hypothetical protein
MVVIWVPFHTGDYAESIGCVSDRLIIMRSDKLVTVFDLFCNGM